jgi:hypothetical protein
MSSIGALPIIGNPDKAPEQIDRNSSVFAVLKKIENLRVTAEESNDALLFAEVRLLEQQLNKVASQSSDHAHTQNIAMLDYTAGRLEESISSDEVLLVEAKIGSLKRQGKSVEAENLGNAILAVPPFDRAKILSTSDPKLSNIKDAVGYQVTYNGQSTPAENPSNRHHFFGKPSAKTPGQPGEQNQTDDYSRLGRSKG